MSLKLINNSNTILMKISTFFIKLDKFIKKLYERAKVNNKQYRWRKDLPYLILSYVLKL